MKVGYSVVCHLDGTVEFCSFQSGGHRPSRSPLVTWARDQESNTAVALLGCLFYREEVVSRLPGAPAQNGTSDAGLVLAAYRHGGPQALKRLEGEFAPALWDGELHRLLALRDPLGSWPLFWLATSRIVAISTSLESLVRLQPGRSFDLDYMAEFLMKPSPVAELPSERTAFEKIQRVLPGTLIQLGKAGQVEKDCYWDWAPHAEHTAEMTLEEAGEGVAHLLRQAVNERIQRETVAAHLSGGMDSSSVVCVARDWMASGVGRPPLLTVTMVYDRPSLAEERVYANIIVKQGGPIAAHFLPADSTLCFQWFAEPIPAHDEPYGGLLGLATEMLLVEAAEQVGATTILTGMGSDESLEAYPYHIADLIRRGRWIKALQEAVPWARAGNRGLWSVLHRYGLEPLWPVSMRDGLRPMWQQGFGRWPTLGRFTIPPWVLPAFARTYQMRRGESARSMCRQPAAFSRDLEAIETSVGDWGRWYLAAPRGLVISHPFRDTRLVRFCLDIPRKLKAVPGERKPVLRAAMRGVIPETILTRRDKQGFDEGYWLGLAKNLPQLEHMVQRSRILELGILDPARVVGVMREAAMGIGDITACARMDQTLALIAWFDQAERCRPAKEGAETYPWGKPASAFPRAAKSGEETGS